ncbi:MAG TPA: hypothetical protein VIS72_02565, partial [Anaerolineales bacterium]
TFANVGAVKATENTHSSCIISGDGLGMTSSLVWSFVKLYTTISGSCHPSLLKMGKVQEL